MRCVLFVVCCGCLSLCEVVEVCGLWRVLFVVVVVLLFGMCCLVVCVAAPNLL